MSGNTWNQVNTNLKLWQVSIELILNLEQLFCVLKQLTVESEEKQPDGEVLQFTLF